MDAGRTTLPSVGRPKGSGTLMAGVVCRFALLIFCLDVSVALYEPYTQWMTAVRLEDYESFKDAQLLSFRVPLDTETLFLNLQAGASHQDCPHRNVKVFARWGSYPVITPYNETFPPHFHLPGGVHEFQVTTDNVSTSISMAQPQAGDWFLAAMLVKAPKKISQKGLSETCQYGMTAITVSKVAVDIAELSMDGSHTVHMRRDLSRTFRFYVPRGLLSYTLSLNKCQVKVNDTATPVSPCPLALRLTEGSVPDPDTPQANCSSMGQNCSLFVGSPLTLAWTYLQVTRLDVTPPDSTFSFLVHFRPTFCRAVGQVVSMDLGDRVEEEEENPRSSSSSSTSNNSNQSHDHPGSQARPHHHYSPSFRGNLSVGGVHPPSGDPSLHWQPGVGGPQAVVEGPDLDLDGRATDQPHAAVVELNVPDQEDAASPPRGDVDPSGQELEEGVSATCVAVVGLGRFRLAQEDFAARFLFPLPDLLPEPANTVRVADHLAVVTHFVVEPEDRGGTLEVSLELDSAPHQQNVSVTLCLTAGQMVRAEDSGQWACSRGVAVQVNSSDSRDASARPRAYLPYPLPGTWYLALTSRCFTEQGVQPCQSPAQVRFDVLLTSCVQGKCGAYGACKEFVSRTSVFSSCQCYGGWRGYGCTDGTDAVGDAMELVSVLLLTLSNLAFLPAIAVALHRRHFTEALVYTYTMFFSTFYHACDSSHLRYYCMTKYDVLSFCDFFGSLMSFWVTLTAMARIPARLRAFLHMAGALGIAIGVEFDRHSLWAFLVPAVVGVAGMLASWGVQCKRRRGCFPSKRRLLLCLLPGILLAATGLVLFAFLETEENYQYTHSAWHVAMATCILFLLPPRRAQDDKGSSSLTEPSPVSFEQFMLDS